MLHGRLVSLCPQELADVAVIHEWYLDGVTAALMGDLPRSLASRQRQFEALADEVGRTWFAFMICRLTDGVAVGRIDLFHIDHVNGSAAFGLAIGDSSQRGRGYGGDAVDALVDFAFGQLRLERVWLLTDEHNERAQHVYRRCGFSVEAGERRAFYQDGRFTNDVRMSMLREAWDRLPRRSTVGTTAPG